MEGIVSRHTRPNFPAVQSFLSLSLIDSRTGLPFGGEPFERVRMDSRHCEEVLLHHGIRPTAVRMLVLDAMERFSDTFTLADLEEATDGMDRSSIYRTLMLFVQHHLLHPVEDGSGSARYCVCHNDHVCRIDEMHCHFHCEACGRTLCLDRTHIPAVACPDGFEVRQIDCMLRGLCPACRAKRRG